MQQKHLELGESPTKLETSKINTSQKQPEIELGMMTSMNQSQNEFDGKNLCVEETDEKTQIRNGSLSQYRMLTNRQSLVSVKLKQLYQQYFDWLEKNGELNIIQSNDENDKISLRIKLESGNFQEDIIQNHKKKNLVVHQKDVNGNNYTKFTYQKLSVKQIEEELKFEKIIQSRQLETINNYTKTIDKLIQKIEDVIKKIQGKDQINEKQGELNQLSIKELQKLLNQLVDDENYSYQFDDEDQSEYRNTIQQKKSNIQQLIVEKEQVNILQQQRTKLEQQLNQQQKTITELETRFKIQSQKIDELENSKKESQPEFRVLKSYQGKYGESENSKKKKKHGQGKLIKYENEFIIEYDGEWVKGKKEGYGILTKYSRDPYSQIYQRYEGMFHNDFLNGYGKKFYNKNGTKFQEGQFKKGKEVGEHILTLIVNNQSVKRRKTYYNYCCFIKLVYEEPI